MSYLTTAVGSGNTVAPIRKKRKETKKGRMIMMHKSIQIPEPESPNPILFVLLRVVMIADVKSTPAYVNQFVKRNKKRDRFQAPKKKRSTKLKRYCFRSAFPPIPCCLVLMCMSPVDRNHSLVHSVEKH